MRGLLLIPIWFVLACGGKYANGQRATAGEADRGETNGRTFDYVSNLPDGEDWQVRVRDSSLWASYSEGAASQEYKDVNLDAKETRRLWDLIDNLGLPDRKKGKKDEEEGYVMLRLREPGGDEGHDVLLSYVSRATRDEDVIAVGDYLRKLILKYHKKQAEF